MLDEKRLAYAEFRLGTARECLNDALLTLEAGSYKASANRSYYCIFHAMRAVLAMDAFDSKRHSGVISEFRRKYIHTGIFPVEMSDYIKIAFEKRGASDYEDFYVISKAEVTEQVENARIFLDAVTQYLDGLDQQGKTGG